MPQLSENQRGLVSMASGLLIYMAAAPQSIVPDGPYAPIIRTGLGLAGVAGLGLQKFLQAGPEEQSAIIELVQRYLAMSPEKQQELLSALPKIMPLLQAMGTTQQAQALP